MDVRIRGQWSSTTWLMYVRMAPAPLFNICEKKQTRYELTMYEYEQKTPRPPTEKSKIIIFRTTHEYITYIHLILDCMWTFCVYIAT